MAKISKKNENSPKNKEKSAKNKINKK